jgi:predicted negative regulator of RcsB-dependent stress response
MATHLDLEEQEQLDEIKHFWKQYGNAITWILIAVLGIFSAWNGYQYLQRSRASQAAAMLEELEKSVRAGDASKIERAFGEMKDRFSSTSYASQAGLMVGKSLFELGQMDGAKSALTWVSDNSADVGLSSIAKIRLAGLLIETKNFEEATKVLTGKISPEFDGMVADRRGDLFMAQGKKPEAKAEYQKAYKTLDERMEYRRLIEVKLNALGVSTNKESQ